VVFLLKEVSTDFQKEFIGISDGLSDLRDFFVDCNDAHMTGPHGNILDDVPVTVLPVAQWLLTQVCVQVLLGSIDLLERRLIRRDLQVSRHELIDFPVFFLTLAEETKAAGSPDPESAILVDSSTVRGVARNLCMPLHL